MEMDINYLIDYLKLNPNTYRLNKSDPPHEIIYWAESNPDPQPTDAELKNAWVKAEVKMKAVIEIQKLELTVTPRRIREMATDEGKKWTSDLDKLIGLERAKFQEKE